ncbi:hypothetical protein HMPREF0578_1490 [Mobiluncus mulieris 28-1]|nr:hypothetical protein HMPREF0578_1490 [Mobiluncus mulieris 28-1]
MSAAGLLGMKSGKFGIGRLILGLVCRFFPEFVAMARYGRFPWGRAGKNYI